ncbi:MAG: hypothetical protein WC588_03085 [Candidatus Micrarchaeia archaeon]
MRQTTIIDPRWNMNPESLEEAKETIRAMMNKLEEAEKLINKSDYDTIEEISKLKNSAPETFKQDVEAIVEELKNRSRAERKPEKPFLCVVPYYKGKKRTGDGRRLTFDLTKKKDFEKHAAKGTEEFRKKVFRTQFPPGLKDEGRGENAEWPFKPEKLEIEERR